MSSYSDNIYDGPPRRERYAEKRVRGWIVSTQPPPPLRRIVRPCDGVKDPLLARICRKLVDTDPMLKSRKPRTLKALSFYVRMRAEGIPHGAALREAANYAGSSRKKLEILVRKYRPLLLDVAEWVVETWRQSAKKSTYQTRPR